MEKVFRSLRGLRSIIFDERGAVTTVEIIGYSVLIGGAVALIGFGIATFGRDKLAETTGDLRDIKAMDDLIETGQSSSSYSGTSGSSGIITEVHSND